LRSISLTRSCKRATSAWCCCRCPAAGSAADAGVASRAVVSGAASRLHAVAPISETDRTEHPMMLILLW
jgi:hypothetical protein